MEAEGSPGGTEATPPVGCRCMWRLVSMVSQLSGMGWVLTEVNEACRIHSGKEQ